MPTPTETELPTLLRDLHEAANAIAPCDSTDTIQHATELLRRMARMPRFRARVVEVGTATVRGSDPTYVATLHLPTIADARLLGMYLYNELELALEVLPR